MVLITYVVPRKLNINVNASDYVAANILTQTDEAGKCLRGKGLVWLIGGEVVC